MKYSNNKQWVQNALNAGHASAASSLYQKGVNAPTSQERLEQAAPDTIGF